MSATLRLRKTHIAIPRHAFDNRRMRPVSFDVFASITQTSKLPRARSSFKSTPDTLWSTRRLESVWRSTGRLLNV